jgi:LAGLIDADG DNA endonuclease family
MQNGSYQKGQGIYIATNSFTFEECNFISIVLTNKYKLKTSVVKTGTPDQWRISIWKESMPLLRQIVKPHFIPEMIYKLGYS